MNAQVQGLNQAARNANDGISAAQTTEGALNQINDNLNRIRVLTVQAENGTNNQDDLDSIQNEIGQRLAEINRISEETEFNGTQVLAKGENLSIQVGANDNQRITINMQKINVKTLTLEGFNVNGKGATANTAATASSLTGAGATRVGTTNEYKMAEANGAVTSDALLANVKNGDVIKANTTPNTALTVASALENATTGATIQIDGTGPTYAATGTGDFSYTENLTSGVAARITADLTAKPGEGPVEAKITIDTTGGTQEVDIKVDTSGNITDLEGNKLYWDNASKNLAATDAGGLSQATAANIGAAFAEADDAVVGTAGSTLKIGDVTYTVGAADNEMAITGQTVTAGAVADLLAAAATKTATINVGPAPGTAVDIDAAGAGTAKVGADAAYLDSTGAVTTTATPSVADFESDYTFDAAKNAFTYSTETSFDGAAPTGASAAKTLLIDAMKADVGTTTKATITLGGASTEVIIASDGSFTNAASGKALYLDASNNLTETKAVGNEPAASLDNVAGALLGKDDASLAIAGGATYTVDNTGGVTSKVTASGLTRTADEVQDLMSQRKGAEFQLVQKSTVDGVADQLVNFSIDNAGKVADAEFAGGPIASGAAYVDADGKLTANETEDTSYWVDADTGNVTNGAGQRVYQDPEGNFTTKETTATPGGRTGDALAVLDAAIAQVDGFRSDLGAIQNRFESAIENLTTTATNLAAAQSRVQDADYAVEVANMTRAQILQQAGTSVLAQANQIPQGVLSLLR